MQISFLCKQYFLCSGRYYRTQNTAGITTHRVTRIITHERWNPFTIDEDIALLSIDPPITYRDNAQPVCLPNRDVFVGEMAQLSGCADVYQNTFN